MAEPDELWRPAYPFWHVKTTPPPADIDMGDIVISGDRSTWTIDPDVLSPFGRSLVGDLDAAAARTTLGIDTLMLGVDQLVYPEQFGAVGDGTTPDHAAFVAARDYALANNCIAIGLRPNKFYVIDGLDITGSLYLICPELWGIMVPGTTSSFPFNAPRIMFRSSATPRELVYWKGPATNDSIVGCGFWGCILDSNNVATWAARFSSCIYPMGMGWLTRSTVGQLLLDDQNGKVNQSGYFPSLRMAIGSSAACAAAKGIYITGDAATRGGSTSHHFGSVMIEYNTGDPVIFEECDSCVIQQLKLIDRVVGATGRVRFSTGNTFPARKNHIGFVSRLKVFAEDQTSNSIGQISGEGTTIAKSGTAVLNYRVVDHGSGDFFETVPYRMSDRLRMPIQSSSVIAGTPVITLAGGNLIPALAFDGAATETVCWVHAPPEDWNDGTITGYELTEQHAGAVTAKAVRIQVALWTRAQTGTGAGAPELTDIQTVTVGDAALTFVKHIITFGTPLAYKRDDMIFCQLSRLGADALDTLDGIDLLVQAFQLTYANSGPNYNVNTGPFAQFDRFLS